MGEAKIKGWNHIIIATDNDTVVSVTSRDFNHEIAGVLHKFLDAPLSTNHIRTVTNTLTFNEIELREVLDLFQEYQQYKEIEFLKSCISYLSSNKSTNNLKFTFCNE